MALQNALAVVALAAPIIKTAIAVVLITAGASKLWDVRRFVEVVRGYAILPNRVVRPFARALPFAEVVTGAALVSSIFVNGLPLAWTGAVAMVLFALFGSAITLNLMRGRTNISCGCFGESGNRKLTWMLAVRAFSYLVVSALTLPLAQPVAGSMDRIGSVLIGGATVAVLWLVRFIVSPRSLGFEFD